MIENSLEIIQTEADFSKNNLFLEQYKALQQEIIQRTQIQYQIVGLSLVIFGTILTLGFERNSFLIIMIYPLLAFFLAAVWAQNDILIRQVRQFVLTTVEDKCFPVGKGWESHRIHLQDKQGVFSILRSSRRIFIGMQIISIFAGIGIIWSQKNYTLFDLIILLLDILLIFFSVLILKRRPL